MKASDLEEFGYKPTKFTASNEWHGEKDPLPESVEFFASMGSRLTVVDFAPMMGMEKIVNLNYPHDLGQFDLVIDPGTLEHCFNIGQAFMNAANAVRVGGRIFHISPMSMLNHGFYNLNPTLFHDFYTQNGWDLEMKVLPNASPAVMSTKRFDMTTEYLIRAMARRNTSAALKMPIQTKYLDKVKS